MQKFFVASLFLMFSCYAGQEHKTTRREMPLGVVNLKSAAAKKKVRSTLMCASTTNLWGNLSPEQIAAIKAKAAAAETTKPAGRAEAAERLEQRIAQIIEKKSASDRPNCAESGTFRRQ